MSEGVYSPKGREIVQIQCGKAGNAIGYWISMRSVIGPLVDFRSCRRRLVVAVWISADCVGEDSFSSLNPSTQLNFFKARVLARLVRGAQD